MTGDFNSILHELDTNNYNTSTHRGLANMTARQAELEYIEATNMVDTYRELEPLGTSYTHSRFSSSRRIDRTYPHKNLVINTYTHIHNMYQTTVPSSLKYAL